MLVELNIPTKLLTSKFTYEENQMYDQSSNSYFTILIQDKQLQDIIGSRLSRFPAPALSILSKDQVAWHDLPEELPEYYSLCRPAIKRIPGDPTIYKLLFIDLKNTITFSVSADITDIITHPTYAND